MEELNACIGYFACKHCSAYIRQFRQFVYNGLHMGE